MQFSKTFVCNIFLKTLSCVSKVLENFLGFEKSDNLFCFVLEDQAGSYEVVVCNTKLLPVITHHPVDAE
jgi:hypothetical protein